MKNGSLRIVVDTNVLYSFFYNPFGDSGNLMMEAIHSKIKLYSTDTVYREIKNLLTKDFKATEDEAAQIIDGLPVEWIGKEIYTNYMKDTEIIQHKSDRPVLALALALNCGILTFDRHFKAAKRMVKLWKIKELLSSTP